MRRGTKRKHQALFKRGESVLKVNIEATGSAARLLLRLKSKKVHGRIVFVRAVIDHLTVITGDLKTMFLTDSQEVDLAIKPVSRKGNPAQVEGAPVWQSSDPAIVEAIPSQDGLSCVAKAVGPVGHAQLGVSADADLGEGVRTITGIFEIDVVAGEAASLTVIAGEPREQA
jgi:hypothetical protein